MSESAASLSTGLVPYAVPAGLWTASALGFAAGMGGDGIWDVIAAVCVGLPVWTIGWFVCVAPARKMKANGHPATTDTSMT